MLMIVNPGCCAIRPGEVARGAVCGIRMPATACVRSREEQQREDRHARAPADPQHQHWAGLRPALCRRRGALRCAGQPGRILRSQHAGAPARPFLPGALREERRGAGLSRRAPVPGVGADVLPHPADRAARLRHRGGRRWPCADRAPATGVEPHRGRAGPGARPAGGAGLRGAGQPGGRRGRGGGAPGAALRAVAQRVDGQPSRPPADAAGADPPGHDQPAASRPIRWLRGRCATKTCRSSSASTR